VTANMNQPTTHRVSDRALLILTSLAGGDKHGYALMQDVSEFSDVKLGPGTLYALLSKLEKDGFVAALPAVERRQPYTLTPAGEEALRVQLAEYAQIARVGLSRVRTTH
jgi:DNA-binding PadR family transcriptional regulator